MTIKEEFFDFYFFHTRKEEIWQWIEEKINQAKIEENKRTVDMFMGLPDSQFSDLEIKRIIESRIKQLEDEK